jgi:ApbE superfamily uncharacterized protein (UPF0280 family)
MPYLDRTYRRWPESELHSFQVRIGESDLWISAERPLTESAERALRSVREDLEGYLQRDPQFARTLRPRTPLANAPAVVLDMADAARICDVGPMAAGAGAVAERVGRVLLAETAQVIVENGGDIFIHTLLPRVAAIFAGESPLSGKLGIRISRLSQPLGLCTSSGTVGPSLSFGRARSGALADAAATALGNRVQEPGDIERALELLETIPGVFGGAVIMGERLGAWGEVELAPIKPSPSSPDEAVIPE